MHTALVIANKTVPTVDTHSHKNSNEFTDGVSCNFDSKHYTQWFMKNKLKHKAGVAAQQQHSNPLNRGGYHSDHPHIVPLSTTSQTRHYIEIPTPTAIR